MRKLLALLLFLASNLCAKEFSYRLEPPRIPESKIVEALPPDPQTHIFSALDTNNAFTGTNSFAGTTTFAGTNTHSGTETFTNRLSTGNFNDTLVVDGVQYATCDAAITAAGSNQRVIIIPPTYAGTNCSTAPVNVTFDDRRGPLNLTTNSLAWNITDALLVHNRFRMAENTVTPLAATSYATIDSFQVVQGALQAGQAYDGLACETDTAGTITSSAVGRLAGCETTVAVNSSGGNVFAATSITSNARMTASNTTSVTTMTDVVAQTIVNSSAAVLNNAYGVVAEDQTAGTTSNLSMWSKGPMQVDKKALFDCTTAAMRCIVIQGNATDNNNELELINTKASGGTWDIGEMNQVGDLDLRNLSNGGSWAFRGPSTTNRGIFVHSNAANRTYTFPDATGTVPLLSLAQPWTAIQNFPSNTAALTADWTCGTAGTVSSCVAATIIGSGGGVPLTFTLPSVAQSYTLECDGIVGQATAVTANQWNLLTATNGATNVTANYTMATAATAYAAGAVTDQASTTTTFQIAPSWTLGAIGTKMPFHIWAKIEGASASGTVVSLQLVAPTVADLVTIYRGTSCRIF